MDLVIDDILNESIEYYQKKKQEIIGRLLLNERGSVIKRHIGNKDYLYLRKKFFGIFIEKYLGPINSRKSQNKENEIKKSKDELISLRQVKYALKKLKVKDMEQEDFTQKIKELFQLMDKEGLWDEGLELIGSWCFKVYQNYLGVEYYPERTLDIDFAVAVPYKGKPVNIGEKLRMLGFEEKIDYSTGSISYESNELKIEFVKDKQGSDKQENPYIKELDIAPIALPYLKILLDHPMTLKLRDLGKITIPSMEAFFAHKLIIADERKVPAKKKKDYQQALAVARSIYQDQDKINNLNNIIQNLHKKRQKKILNSAKEAKKLALGDTEILLNLLGKSGVFKDLLT